MTAQGEEFDLIVIGSGPGGYVCAIRAAQLGFKTACVEKEKTLGGTCLNVGCIPSKALLESSHHYHRLLHEFKDHGISATSPKMNVSKMIERKAGVVSSITKGVEFLFKKNKVTSFEGLGSFVSQNEIKVTSSAGKSQTLRGKNIIIATGSSPIELPFAPFDHKTIIDSEDALKLSSVPKSLAVVGGGVIGLELGSVWSRLGAKVSTYEYNDKILGATDRKISSLMQRILEKQGLSFNLKTQVKAIKKSGKGAEITFVKNEKEETLKVDKVLVAVGRKPNTEGLNLEAVGLKTNKRGQIETGDHYTTNVKGIYAIGDVIKGPMLAHKASDEGIALAEHIAGRFSHVNYRAIPSVVYTSPELACVGMSEEECKEKGVSYKTGQFNFKANGRAKAMGEEEGLVKMIADSETDKLLGVHIIGPNASELISEAVIAFEYGASAEDIARSVHAHPTLAESLKEAALDVDKRAIHS